MDIMILTGYYEPEIAASLYLLSNMAEDIAAKGCRVNIITPVPVRGVDDNTRCQYRHMKREVKCRGNLIIHRVFMPFKEPKGVLLRAIRYLFVTAALFLKALTIKTDVIFVDSTPPTLGLIGIWLRCIKHVPAVYNLQDIFPDSLANSGISTCGPVIMVGKRLERLIYCGMDRIVTISGDFKRIIMEKGVPEDKIDIIYNWSDENAVIPVSRTENLLFESLGLPLEAFYITYCGNLGHTQNLELLIDAARSLEEYHDLQFVIIGDGVRKQELESYAGKKKAGNVRFLPFLPYERISHVFSLGDVSLVISKCGIGRSSFPSKAWSIMSASRPVLASFDEDSELCTIINKVGCGICVPPEDFHSLRQAILYLYENRSIAQSLGNNGREFILKNLTRSAGTEKWFKVLTDLILNPFRI
jgi:glycosyltransferase involved in cell wall biosynthesis